MGEAKQERGRPSKEFNIAILAITLCVQLVGSVNAIDQSRWLVAGALVVLAATNVVVLRALTRSRAH